MAEPRKEAGIGIFEKFIRQNSLKSIFSGKWKAADEVETSPKLIPQLSVIANSIVSRCSKILLISTEELQLRFESELPDHLKKPSTYARNLLEYCSYQTLDFLTQRPGYLGSKEFRRLSFDMMLAWEAPGIGSDSLLKESKAQNDSDSEDEEGGSLFYSDSINLAVKVADKKTVGLEAFARIAPACPAIADIITVHNLFDALTSSSGGQLHFLIYNKYLGGLEKVLKPSKSTIGQSSSLELAEGELMLDFEGSVPTQPVLQHIGVSAWPGRLTLTNRALYFESIGVGSFDKAVVYDLAKDLKQVLKPELTGPLGARLFDKAVMIKSTSIVEPVYLEFPEFKGHSRRDYWLAISREVLNVHRFIRKFNLKSIGKSEALAKATLGIFRVRAIREAFHILPSRYKSLLAFDLAENIPGGDMVLETLSSRLELLNDQYQKHDVQAGDSSDPNNGKSRSGLAPISLLTLKRLGFILSKEEDVTVDAIFLVGDVCVGETNPLEMTVKQSKFASDKAEAAQATVDQVKVEGIDINIAVMKELLFPLIEFGRRLHFLASWNERSKSSMFMVLTCYVIYRDWIKYIMPGLSVLFAILMLWRRYRNKGKALEPLKVVSPPSRNPVEQLIVLQEAISQFETLIQAGNILLLKLRAILFAALPQATDKVALMLMVMAAVFAFVPLKYLAMLVFLEAFTREMPLRKESNDKFVRRIREWWVRIPAAPVLINRIDESKKKK